MENKNETWNKALSLFTESVMKPDPELRKDAHEQKCMEDFMFIRETVLEFLKHLRRS